MCQSAIAWAGISRVVYGACDIRQTASQIFVWCACSWRLVSHVRFGAYSCCLYLSRHVCPLPLNPRMESNRHRTLHHASAIPTRLSCPFTQPAPLIPFINPINLIIITITTIIILSSPSPYVTTTIYHLMLTSHPISGPRKLRARAS